MEILKFAPYKFKKGDFVQIIDKSYPQYDEILDSLNYSNWLTRDRNGCYNLSYTSYFGKIVRRTANQKYGNQYMVQVISTQSRAASPCYDSYAKSPKVGIRLNEKLLNLACEVCKVSTCLTVVE